MKQTIIKFMILGLLIAAPISVYAKVNIFACEPEWKSLAQEIGGDKIEVKSATTAYQDPHHIRARPSLIAAIIKADILFCTGMELESGWLPILLQKAKKQVQPGNIGYFMSGNYVNALEVPIELDRKNGDVHSSGNPHIHLDPYNIILIAKELTKTLGVLDSENKSYYQENLQIFLLKWRILIKKWELQAKTLKNMKIAVNHRHWSYLTNWLNLNQVITLEPVPGIPPTISHLEKILIVLKKQQVKAIISTEFEDKKASQWLGKKLDISELTLPFTVGSKEVQNLEQLFEKIIESLLQVR